MDLYDFPFTYRGLTFNEHRSAVGALVEANLGNSIRVDRFDFSKLQQRDQREPLHLLTGGDLGDATLAFRYLALAGSIVAPTGSKLSDKIGALMQAFNVEEAQRASPLTEGVTAFGFTDVTEFDTTRGTAWLEPRTGLAAGYYVAEQYLARPAGYPVVTQRRSGGNSATFACELICPDPRRYIQTAESIVLNGANGFSKVCPNWNASMGVAVSPVATIVLTAAGHAAFTLNFPGDGITNLILDLSGIGGGAHTVIVDYVTGRITLDGVDAANLRTSGVSSLGSFIVRGGDTASAVNTTNVTSVTIAYRQARAA